MSARARDVEVQLADAEAELASLRAERRQAQEERDRMRFLRDKYVNERDESERQRRLAIDALREIAKRQGQASHSPGEVARAALVKLGEQSQSIYKGTPQPHGIACRCLECVQFGEPQ